MTAALPRNESRSSSLNFPVLKLQLDHRICFLHNKHLLIITLDHVDKLPVEGVGEKYLKKMEVVQKLHLLEQFIGVSERDTGSYHATLVS